MLTCTLHRAESPLVHTKPLYGLAGAPVKSIFHNSALWISIWGGGGGRRAGGEKKKERNHKKGVADGEDVVAEDTRLSRDTM